MEKGQIVDRGPDSFLSIEEVIAILNVTRDRLRDWRKDDAVDLPYRVFGRGLIRYRKSDVDAFIENSKR